MTSSNTPPPEPPTWPPHLVPQVLDGLEVGAVVTGRPGPLILVPVTDLHLQLRVGLLQGAHLLQVGGQAVVEVLHGDLLIAREEAAIATTEADSKATTISSNEDATQGPTKAAAAAEAATIAAPKPADTPGGLAGGGDRQALVGAGGPAGASGRDGRPVARATTDATRSP